jgi:hypothetical protein
MTFEIALSKREKWFIVEHSEPALTPQCSHGEVARMLGHVFSEHNGGKRSRMTVYLWRNTSEFREMREQNAPKKESKEISA